MDFSSESRATSLGRLVRWEVLWSSAHPKVVEKCPACRAISCLFGCAEPEGALLTYLFRSSLSARLGDSVCFKCFLCCLKLDLSWISFSLLFSSTSLFSLLPGARISRSPRSLLYLCCEGAAAGCSILCFQRSSSQVDEGFSSSSTA